MLRLVDIAASHCCFRKNNNSNSNSKEEQQQLELDPFQVQLTFVFVVLTAHQQFRPFCASFFAFVCLFYLRLDEDRWSAGNTMRGTWNVAIVGQFDVCAFLFCFPIRVDSLARSRPRGSGSPFPLPRVDQSIRTGCSFPRNWDDSGLCMGPQGEFSSVAHEAWQKVICSNRIRRNQLLLPVGAKGHVWQQKILTVAAAVAPPSTPPTWLRSPHSAMSNYNLIQLQFWPKNTPKRTTHTHTHTRTHTHIQTGTLLLLEYRLARQAALITTTMLATTKQLGWLCLIRRRASE